jgi:hypothetical protein
MSDNQFTEKYKSLSTRQLVAIVDNPKDYQPLAVVTAKFELNSRQLTSQDIDSVRNAILTEQLDKQNASDQKKQKQKVVVDKALKVSDYADPLVEKTPEKSIILISVILLAISIFKIVNNYPHIIFRLKDFDVWKTITDVDFVETIWLPIAVVLFWLKKNTGRQMIFIWLCFSLLMTSILTYYSFQLKDADPAFLRFNMTPSLSTCLVMFLFYGGLLYYINTKKIKGLFATVVDEDGT